MSSRPPVAGRAEMGLIGVLLGVSWLILQRSLHPGDVVIAAVLAVVLPWVTRRFWPARSHIAPGWMVLRVTRRLLWDIVVANLEVASLILGPSRRLQPAFFEVPLDIRDEFAISVLSSLISLTPGTVSVEVSGDLRTLRVHGLRVDDEAAMVERIKSRYEQALAEIFSC